MFGLLFDIEPDHKIISYTSWSWKWFEKSQHYIVNCIFLWHYSKIFAFQVFFSCPTFCLHYSTLPWRNLHLLFHWSNGSSKPKFWTCSEYIDKYSWQMWKCSWVFRVRSMVLWLSVWDGGDGDNVETTAAHFLKKNYSPVER